MRKRSTAAAFSLVEVTLALGIAAFCLIAVIGLVPVAVLTNRNATSQTAATNIMAAVVADLRATPKANPASTQFGITFGTSGTQTRYFDRTGSCSCDSAGLQKFNSGTGSCSLTWIPALQLRYQLNVTWNGSGWNGLRYADVKVRWPAAATAANAAGSTEVFAGFDRN
ncbi:MAG TPA: hypothetical protein VGM65_02230 [Candidatus Udaeobacter sp.]|jgi:hypothetical protein